MHDSALSVLHLLLLCNASLNLYTHTCIYIQKNLFDIHVLVYAYVDCKKKKIKIRFASLKNISTSKSKVYIYVYSY